MRLKSKKLILLQEEFSVHEYSFLLTLLEENPLRPLLTYGNDCELPCEKTNLKAYFEFITKGSTFPENVGSVNPLGKILIRSLFIFLFENQFVLIPRILISLQKYGQTYHSFQSSILTIWVVSIVSN